MCEIALGDDMAAYRFLDLDLEEIYVNVRIPKQCNKCGAPGNIGVACEYCGVRY